LPDLPNVTAKHLVRALKKLGFHEVRQKGSHLQLKRGNLLVTVPVHGGDVSREVLRSILRQTRLAVDELREIL